MTIDDRPARRRQLDNLRLLLTSKLVEVAGRSQSNRSTADQHEECEHEDAQKSNTSVHAATHGTAWVAWARRAAPPPRIVSHQGLESALAPTSFATLMYLTWVASTMPRSFSAISRMRTEEPR